MLFVLLLQPTTYNKNFRKLVFLEYIQDGYKLRLLNRPLCPLSMARFPLVFTGTLNEHEGQVNNRTAIFSRANAP